MLNREWFFLLLIIHLAVWPCALLAQTNLEVSGPAHIVRLAHGWEYRATGAAEKYPASPQVADSGETSEWRPIKKLSLAEQKEGLSFWFRTPLPQIPWEDSQILLQTDAPAFAVFLEGAKIYQFGDPTGKAPKRFPDLTWHLIPVPPGFQGRRIYLWVPDLRPYDVFIENAALAPRRAFPQLISETAKAPFRKDFLQNPLRLLALVPGLSALLPSPLKVPPDLASENSKAPFRRDFLQIPLGVLFAALGLSGLLLSLFPRKSRDLSLIFFGAFSLLYGARLLIDSYSTRFLIPAPPFFWPHLSALVTYTVSIPFTLFAEQFLGKGWKNSIRLSLLVQALFAVGAVAADILLRTPYSALLWESYLSILVVVVILANGLRSGLPATPELRVMGAGFVIFVVFTVHENLVSMRLFPLNLGLEALGLMLFIGCLGYAAARRFFTRERQMAALEQELETARRIQFSILPRQAPEILGLDIATRYLPMASVAGDFYDFLPADGHGLSILVADVSGHGVPAALIASMVKVAFASQASRASDPAHILAGMNQALCGGPEDRFITAGCLFVDSGKREMVYAGAGHPPLFLWRKGEGRIREFCNNGLVMGPFPEARYENVSLTLEPGDRMVMYTDGITEARNASGEFFGEERFKEFIQNHEELPAGRFTDALIAHIAAWSGKKSGGVLDDDLTLVVVDVAIRGKA